MDPNRPAFQPGKPFRTKTSAARAPQNRQLRRPHNAQNPASGQNTFWRTSSQKLPTTTLATQVRPGPNINKGIPLGAPLVVPPFSHPQSCESSVSPVHPLPPGETHAYGTFRPEARGTPIQDRDSYAKIVKPFYGGDASKAPNHRFVIPASDGFVEEWEFATESSIYLRIAAKGRVRVFIYGSDGHLLVDFRKNQIVWKHLNRLLESRPATLGKVLRRMDEFFISRDRYETHFELLAADAKRHDDHPRKLPPHKIVQYMQVIAAERTISLQTYEGGHPFEKYLIELGFPRAHLHTRKGRDAWMNPPFSPGREPNGQ